MAKKGSVYDRLSDVRSFTGMYKKRFDPNAYDQSEAVVHDMSNIMRPNLNRDVDPKSKRISSPRVPNQNLSMKEPKQIDNLPTPPEGPTLPPAPSPRKTAPNATSSTTVGTTQTARKATPPQAATHSTTSPTGSNATPATATAVATAATPKCQGDPNDPHTLLKAVFRHYCRFGRTTSKGSDEKTLDNANFAKLFRDCPDLLDAKFTKTDIDLIFVKAKKKGERRISYPQFLDAMGMIAVQKYSDMPLETSVPKLIENHIAKLPCMSDFVNGKSVQAVWIKSKEEEEAHENGQGGGDKVQDNCQ